MSIRIIRDENRTYKVLSAKKARIKYENFKYTSNLYFILMFVSMFFSPFLFFLFLVIWYRKYVKDLKGLFFINERVKSLYETILRPVVSSKVYTIIGYRIYLEDWESHRAILRRDSKSKAKALAKKAKIMRKKSYMQLGFDKDTLTRHFIFLGTTGAGKTETVMTLLEAVIKSGGGFMMIDGKSDQAMENKIATLCKKHKYETQLQFIILNKPEARPESNTYNPALSYLSAFKTSEFLGELLDNLDSGGGGGNGDYFKNRGKVMLGNNVIFYKSREKYYGEKFTINDLAITTDVVEMNNIFYLNYAVSQELEKRIKAKMREDRWFDEKMKEAQVGKSPSIEYIKHTEWLVEYINRNAHYQRKVEAVLGLDMDFVRNVYDFVFAFVPYIAGISPYWKKYAEVVAKVIYEILRAEEKKFLYIEINPANVSDIRKVYNEMKKEDGGKYGSKIRRFFNRNPELKRDYMEAMGFEESEATVENLPQDAIQQHSYAKQQWERLFAVLKEYAHITNTPTPEVDIEDLFKNNKCLYIMLPVMELSTDLVKVLGSTFVLMFKNLASIALGGDRQESLPVQFRIFQDQIKPVPLYIAIYDEYGAYPVQKAMPMILAQVRSLNCSILLSVQDIASLQPMQENRWERNRSIGNTTKIILETKDDDVWELVQKVIPELEYLEAQTYVKDAINENIIYGDNSSGLKPEKRKPLSENIAKEFGTGMGMLVGQDEEPILFQSYYAGGEEKKLTITKLEDFFVMYNNV